MVLTMVVMVVMVMVLGYEDWPLPDQANPSGQAISTPHISLPGLGEMVMEVIVMVIGAGV